MMNAAATPLLGLGWIRVWRQIKPFVCWFGGSISPNSAQNYEGGPCPCERWNDSVRNFCWAQTPHNIIFFKVAISNQTRRPKIKSTWATLFSFTVYSLTLEKIKINKSSKRYPSCLVLFNEESLSFNTTKQSWNYINKHLISLSITHQSIHPFFFILQLQQPRPFSPALTPPPTSRMKKTFL